MQWFKHYSNISASNKITELKSIGGKSMYADYVILLEIMCSKFTGSETEFVIDRTELKHLTLSRTYQLVSNSLSTMSQLGIISYTTRNQVYVIETDIMLRLQGKDFKYENAKRGMSDPKNKSKNKNKNKRESQDSVAHNVIINSFNTVLGGFNNIKFADLWLSPTCVEKLEVCSGHPKMQEHDSWHAYFEKVKSSEFLTGQTERKFQTSLRWLLEPDNMQKVHDGLYENNTHGKSNYELRPGDTDW